MDTWTGLAAMLATYNKSYVRSVVAGGGAGNAGAPPALSCGGMLRDFANFVAQLPLGVPQIGGGAASGADEHETPTAARAQRAKTRRRGVRGWAVEGGWWASRSTRQFAELRGVKLPDLARGTRGGGIKMGGLAGKNGGRLLPTAACGVATPALKIASCRHHERLEQARVVEQFGAAELCVAESKVRGFLAGGASFSRRGRGPHGASRGWAWWS
jgi:hypothetical protein